MDSTNFRASKTIAAAPVRVWTPKAMRELYCRSRASEWQYYIQRKGTLAAVERPRAKAPTMNINANDVGFVPGLAGHSVEGLASNDVLFWRYQSSYYSDISLNQWIRRFPPLMV
jgi:oxalate decarboxylase